MSLCVHCKMSKLSLICVESLPLFYGPAEPLDRAALALLTRADVDAGLSICSLFLEPVRGIEIKLSKVASNTDEDSWQEEILMQSTPKLHDRASLSASADTSLPRKAPHTPIKRDIDRSELIETPPRNTKRYRFSHRAARALEFGR